MSLISVKNFSAPFTKRGYLFTLVLVVLLFAILRVSIRTEIPDFSSRAALTGNSLAGSALYPGSFGNAPAAAPLARVAAPARREAPAAPSRSGSESALQGVAAAGFFDMAPSSPEAAPMARPVPVESSSSDVLGEILGTSSAAAEKAEAARVAEGRDAGQLGDVEKMVGLR
jgi:hypothetical protein